jgi:hypothetical protein
MNCLEYALNFWANNRNYPIWYNSDHVVNLPVGVVCTGFLPLESFGFEHLIKSFEIGEREKEILNEYFKQF